MPRVMSATQVRMHFGDVMRRVAETGEPVIVERAGKPRVAVVPLSDYERLRELETAEVRPRNRAALDWLDRWLSTPDEMGDNWWESFERELREHPVTLGEST
ncbi:MAG TPA: type II toxin-antitoxin system Phd/YefM family antitoxin [Chloroflexi bacterium]|nr:type II toxin-antitoxin system Phd/YefM family antitoxin [Chloroflexota bacterium]